MRSKVYLLLLGLSILITSIGLGAVGNWQVAVNSTIISEGGSRYTNDPRDPGGPTKYGITLHDLQKHVNPQATAIDVWLLTRDQATSIYLAHYWRAIRGDELPKGVDYTIFDYAVNSGVSRVSRILRTLLGLPPNPPVIDNEVIRRLNEETPTSVINAVNNERLAFLRSLHTFPIFGVGWENRVHSVRLISLIMAYPKEEGSFTFRYIPRVGPGKAYEEDEDGTGNNLQPPLP